MASIWSSRSNETRAFPNTTTDSSKIHQGHAGDDFSLSLKMLSAENDKKKPLNQNRLMAAIDTIPLAPKPPTDSSEFKGHNQKPRPAGVVPINLIYIPHPETVARTKHTDVDYTSITRQLEALGEKYGFEVIPMKSSEHLSVWTRDGAIPAADPDQGYDSGAQKVIFLPNTGVTAENFSWLSRRVGPLPDTLSPQYKGGGLRDTKALEAYAKANGYQVKQIPVFIDGGNMLTTTLPSHGGEAGKLVSILGAGSVTANALMLDWMGQIDAADVQHRVDESRWSEVEIETMMQELKKRDNDSSGLYSSRAGDDLQTKSKEFLAKLDITKGIIADSLNLSEDELVVVPQGAYHIDLDMNPGKDGEIFVADQNASKALLLKMLNTDGISNEERSRLESMLAESTELDFGPKYTEVLDRKVKILEELGFVVHRVPANFQDLNKPDVAPKHPPVRLLNGVMGKDRETGQAYFITASSGLESIDQAFSETLGALGYTVHFIDGMSNLLRRQGGLGCITLQSQTINSEQTA